MLPVDFTPRKSNVTVNAASFNMPETSIHNTFPSAQFQEQDVSDTFSYDAIEMSETTNSAFAMQTTKPHPEEEMSRSDPAKTCSLNITQEDAAQSTLLQRGDSDGSFKKRGNSSDHSTEDAKGSPTAASPGKENTQPDNDTKQQ